MIDFVVNPRAQNVSRLMPRVEERLRREGVEYTLHSGGSKEETVAIAKELTANGGGTVVAVGGDGTLSDVLTGIERFDGLSLGLLPFGTGNDFAAAAHIPENETALDLILSGEARPTDFIELGDGQRSINIAGLGIDVDILERCYRMKHGGAKSKYFRGLIASLCHYKGQRIEVTADGGTIAKTAFIAGICNGTQFGGGIPICPPAVIDDGKLDLILIECPKRVKIPFELVRLMKGKILERPISTHLLCEEAHIVQVEGEYVQHDGELVKSRSISARVVHGKLNMFRG